MKFGVVYPQTEFGNDPVAIRDFAQAIEGLGFNHILAYDHILGANPDRPGGWQGPYTHQSAFQEPLVLFSFMAGVTTRLGFTTGIVILPQRQTAVFAKQAATLDVLSGGRIRLGVGLGWNEVEYTALNENFHTRGQRMSEQVQLLRRLWTEELVTFNGRWHSIPDAGLNPLPVQRPIPIWFGGSAEPALKRAANLADGWMPGHRTAVDARPALNQLAVYLAQAGRPPETFGIEARLHYGDSDPEVWLKIIQGWEAAGATYLGLNTMGVGFRSPAEHLAAVQKFARVVGIQ
jgi:probable F420-dependent oxidoreductase